MRFLIDQPGIDLLSRGKKNKKDLLDILHNKKLMHPKFYKHVVAEVEKQKKALKAKEESNVSTEKQEL